MNPLLFADWRRVNRLFTRTMWAAAALMACVICIVVISAGARAHAAPPPHPHPGKPDVGLVR
jgi:hypothetical protein